MSTTTKQKPGTRRGENADATALKSIAGRAALSTEEAAHYIGLAHGTLKKWRVTGDGPAYVQAGSRVVYLIEDLDAWLHEHRVA